MPGFARHWSAVTLAGALIAGCSGEGASEEGVPEVVASEPVQTATFDAEAAAALGDGYVVWESNRSGAWRIWTRRLDGSGLHQLSRDEQGRQHCCAHISPDGSRLVYLSLQGGGREYVDGDVTGALRVIAADGTGERELAAEARTYFENRAAVWRSGSELIFVGADGRTMLLDVESGRSEALVQDPSPEYGWLVNASLTHATRGLPSFSPLNRVRGRVAERTVLGGCQPYFSHDGRWGYWMAGAGGPVHRIDLASRETAPLLRKNDPLLPAGRGYIYFPMTSRDGRLLAVGASRGQHDTFAADYEIFVLEIDPRTLEPRAPAVRFTFDPAVDRFPDVFAEPLALGDHRGEAPFLLRLETGDAREWSWDFGDGKHPVGPSATYRFEQPGLFRVMAKRGEETRVGMVRVVPAAPPRFLRAEVLDGGRRVIVWLDEPVDASRLAVSFESGREVASWAVGAESRSVVVAPASPIEGPDRLVLAGLRDRAQQPNVAAKLAVDLEPPLWPSDESGLAFLWQTADAANLVRDRQAGIDRAPTLTAEGGATLDHAFAMLLAGGTFAGDPETAALLVAELRRANEVSLEMTVRSDGPGDGRILLVGAERRKAFALSQSGGSLVARFRVKKPRDDQWSPPVELFALEPGRPTHVAITYRPGLLTAYRDGELVRTSEAVQGDFYQWDRGGLSFGGGWSGTVEGVAIYSRVLDAGEVRENAERHRSLRGERPAVARVVIDAVRTAASAPPTLEEISPYRQALAVSEYRVERVVSGSLTARTVRVAEWAILGGEVVESADGPRRLVLERFADNPQLDGVVLANDLGAGDLHYAVPGG